MSSVDPTIPQDRTALRTPRVTRLRNAIAVCDPWFRVLGLAWITPPVTADVRR